MAKNGGKYRPVAKQREKMVHKAQNLESDEFARDDRYLAASKDGIVLLQDSYLSFIAQRLTSEWAKRSSEIIRVLYNTFDSQTETRIKQGYQL